MAYLTADRAGFHEGRREDRARLKKVLSDLSIKQLGTLPTSAIDSQPQDRVCP